MKWKTFKATTVSLSTRRSHSRRPRHNQSPDKPLCFTGSYANRARVVNAPPSEIVSAAFCRRPTPSAVLHRLLPPPSAIICRAPPPPSTVAASLPTATGRRLTC
ncbi:hypothetical protein F2Q70_00035806 [Brassica cretica]|uniref:Uncharacterized protein n=1 Tax=Brassica cretica TaxID=69181 RepID=A0A8S9K0L0_BRACR|nr:hypothetical protein F2Q70_00035806 [Brassica cretica]